MLLAQIKPVALLFGWKSNIDTLDLAFYVDQICKRNHTALRQLVQQGQTE
jgi:hypothetical protein